MDTNTSTTRGAQRRGTSLGVGIAAALLLSLPACAAHEHVVATRTTTTVERTAVAPAKTVDISIVGLHDEPAVDPAQERVVGTIVNDGDRRVTGLSIRVDAVDDTGRVVNSVVTPPLRQDIDAYGGRATFEALMPRDATVAGYHAVAVAR